MSIYLTVRMRGVGGVRGSRLKSASKMDCGINFRGKMRDIFFLL